MEINFSEECLERGMDSRHKMFRDFLGHLNYPWEKKRFNILKCQLWTKLLPHFHRSHQKRKGRF